MKTFLLKFENQYIDSVLKLKKTSISKSLICILLSVINEDLKRKVKTVIRSFS